MAETPFTLRQLAKLAGVSRTTVSLALRNHPRLAETTRRRIQDLAAKNGYTPDPLTSTLMNHLRTARKSRSVEKLAYLTWWNSPDEWRKSPNDRNWFEGARTRAEALGYEIEHIWAREPGMTAARLSKILYTRAIRGVIVAPLLRPRGHLSLDWQHLATAAISFTVVKPYLHRTAHSHHNGIIIALRRLKQLGYRRVGLANLSDQIERVNHGWLAGYLVYTHGVPRRDQIPPLLQKGWNEKKFAEWLDRYKPDAVVSNTQDPLHSLKKLGYRVPRDIAYACLDRLKEDDTWAGIDQLPQLVAASAVDLVAAQLQRNEFGLPANPKTVYIDGVWRDGETVKIRPA
jgi:LacI family transcriptional regulator